MMYYKLVFGATITMRTITQAHAKWFQIKINIIQSFELYSLPSPEASSKRKGQRIKSNERGNMIQSRLRKHDN